MKKKSSLKEKITSILVEELSTKLKEYLKNFQKENISKVIPSLFFSPRNLALSFPLKNS